MTASPLVLPRLAAALTLVAAASLQAQESTPARGGEPAVQRIVQEDDQTRIEELRVRGQTRRLVVTPKNSRAPAYEIVTDTTGRDTADGRRGAVGQRVWNVLGF